MFHFNDSGCINIRTFNTAKYDKEISEVYVYKVGK